MSLIEVEARVKELDREIERLEKLTEENGEEYNIAVEGVKTLKNDLIAEAYENLTPYDKVYIARKHNRPNARDYIDNIFQYFFEQRGDRNSKDDHAIIGGIARFAGVPVTVVGNLKGHNLEENLDCNFGMANPEGYRKAIRIMKQAEKFQRPIITFIDTSGAYPGMEAEMHGQGEAIARSLMEMSTLSVPIISFVIGEGGSGGALAISIANKIYMLENAVYSILSPEGFASILWKDSTRAKEASDVMKITAQDLQELNIVDGIINEPKGDLADNPEMVYSQIRLILAEEFKQMLKLNPKQLVDQRYKKFRVIGDCSS